MTVQKFYFVSLSLAQQAVYI